MKMALVIAACLFACGCAERRESAPKTETAIVLDRAHVPAKKIDIAGSPGVDGKGRLTYNFGSTATQAETWATTFRCDRHQAVFTLDSKDIWGSCQIGDVVTLYYVDIEEEGPKDVWTVVDHRTTSVSVLKPAKEVER